MSDELDQTIEELEAEVLAELEEAEDPQKRVLLLLRQLIIQTNQRQAKAKRHKILVSLQLTQNKKIPLLRRLLLLLKKSVVTLSKRVRENLINLRNLLLVMSLKTRTARFICLRKMTTALIRQKRTKMELLLLQKLLRMMNMLGTVIQV